ncbi:hypothetical protein [Luteimonas fraxinea]|uniref:hypothetical protein n=1 Tax=Luteimonas fraxinea TaxID=2901869 RepID=UPI001E494577|nr:hypothetical protein [Luteimonas fraxinea]MCD9126392.1 hypothetical protein [Luteimonas fraxinea]
MKPKIGTAAIIFISSYLPLALIQLVQNISDESWKSGFCSNIRDCRIPDFNHSGHSLGLFLAALICTVIFMFAVRKAKKRFSGKVVSSKLIQSDFVNYSLPYIVSFMSLDMESPQKIFGFYVFMGTLFWVNYKSGQLILNPILVAFDWKLYEVELNIDNNIRTGQMLSQTKVIPEEAVEYAAIDEVWIRK